MSVPYVLRYIAEGEHHRQDFKMRVDDARKIARTLVAFANSEGGRLLIGVKDNGSVSGINAEEEFHMIEAAASAHCRPSIVFDAQVWKVDNRQVLEVNIHPSPLRPHSAEVEKGEWKVFIRREDQNLPAPKVLLEVWKNTEEDRPQRYFHTEKEKRIFNSLSEAGSLTQSQLIRRTGIHRDVMIKLLSRFIRWDLIEMFFVQDQAWFRLR